VIIGEICGRKGFFWVNSFKISSFLIGHKCPKKKTSQIHSKKGHKESDIWVKDHLSVLFQKSKKTLVPEVAENKKVRTPRHVTSKPLLGRVCR
jgi:hypothetical protein